MTETGLSTINMSMLSTLQQIILFIMMLIGSPIFVSYFIVIVRMRAFNSKLEEMMSKSGNHPQYRPGPIIKSFRKPSPYSSAFLENASSEYHRSWKIEELLPFDSRKDVISPSPEDSYWSSSPTVDSILNSSSKLTDAEYVHYEIRLPNERRFSHHEAINSPIRAVKRRDLLSNMPRTKSDEVLGRNMPFPHIHSDSISKSIEAQIEHLSFKTSLPAANYLLKPNSSSSNQNSNRRRRTQHGGSEHGALRLLIYLIPAYFIIFQLLGGLSSALYITYHEGSLTPNALNTWWLGIFLSISAFNNCGLSLLDAGILPFQSDTFLLVSWSFLVLAGFVAYPIMLRLLLWLASWLCSKSIRYERWSQILRFILDYPRRVYTNIFPSAHTWWLLFVLMLLNGIDWIAFIVFNIDNPALTVLPSPLRGVVGFFQSISIRSAGFSIVPITQLTIGTQIIILVMMYISAYPVVITLRSSNVYEERSLGIYQGDIQRNKDPEKKMEDGPRRLFGIGTRLFFLRQQIQHQLAHDMWWLALSVILVVCIEASNYGADPITYSVFNIIFEVVSAYGPVGLSAGVPNEAYSLSGGFHNASKVVVCAVMIRGRHRGLPVAIDKAVLLPGEKGDLVEGNGTCLYETRETGIDQPAEHACCSEKAHEQMSGSRAGM